jgi:protein phosphatase
VAQDTTQVALACRTRKGGEHSLNEDAIGFCGWTLSGESPDLFPAWRSLDFGLVGGQRAVITVADGVGGRHSSHVASRLVAERTSRAEVAAKQSAVGVVVNQAHQELLDLGRANPELVGMGTTVVGVILFADGEVGYFNVGDSRLYYTNVGTLVLATEDDIEDVPLAYNRTRLRAWVGREELARLDPKANRMKADGYRRLLLCSDGLYQGVPSPNWLERLVCDRKLTPADVVAQLFEATKGAADDVTAVVVDIWAARFNPGVWPTDPLAAGFQPRRG